jgi:hypothetical protein
MNFLAMHHQWEVSLWRNVVDCLKVFTTANRPLGALFYRPMYSAFGFDAFPYRVVVYIILLLNIVLAYRFARMVGATREGAALATLLFSYNASLADLYYSTGTIYDVLCFPLFLSAFLVYVRGRSKGQLRGKTMAIVMVLFLAALDAKEMAVMLPADLLFYELLFRRQDLKSRTSLIRVGGFMAVVVVVAAIFLKVKVSDMGTNDLYHPNASVAFFLKGMGHYFEQYFYLKPNTCGVMQSAAIIAVLLGAGAALRNRTAIFGMLFYIAGAVPVALIVPRGGYAAYVAFPGLTLAIGAILNSIRVLLLRISKQEKFGRASAVLLFLLVAFVSIKTFARYRKEGVANLLWSQQQVNGLLDAFKRQVPDLPPNARILITQDPWGPDWGPMFLIRLQYHDPNVWVDRTPNPEKTGDRDSYDILVKYKEPYLEMVPDTIFGYKMKWEVHAKARTPGELEITAPTESRAPRNIDFSPAATRTGRPVTVTIPGVANVKVDAVYRILAGGKSTMRVAEGWCTVDAKGQCTVNAPPAGQVGVMVVDWIRRTNERWIFTSGVLTVVE